MTDIGYVIGAAFVWVFIVSFVIGYKVGKKEKAND